MSAWMAALAGALTAGCAVNAGPETMPTARCDFVRYHLEVEPPDPESRLRAGRARVASGERSFADALRSVYAEPREAAVSDSMLFLSGGSQDGAFGAGFLDGWSRRRGRERLPDFRVVTGISTGAILSTWAFIDEADKLATSYRIAREGRILRAYIRPGSDLSMAKAVATKGAVGDLGPLKQLLLDNLTPQAFGRIAEQRRRGRALYIGAVDVDSGKAVAFDMTEMAQRYVDAPLDRKPLFRNCYADAVIASSSVPLAAPPTFIDNRMYIDGGARFGIFSDELGAVVETSDESVVSEGPPFIYVIVNGDLTTPEACGKANPADCPAGTSGGSKGRHADWRIQELAGRSATILINQVYLSSVERIQRLASDREFGFLIDYIRADAGKFRFVMDDPRLGEGEHGCAEWSEIDERIDRPVEFHPRYMHCLIAYGDSRAGVQGWAGLE